MTAVLLLGLDPATVDFGDPAISPGMTAEKIRAGIHVALEQMKARGWSVEQCLIRPGGTAVAAAESCLAGKHFDCIVIGAGVRLPARHLILFEALINTIRRIAPSTPIAFNTHPEDSAIAAERWIR